MPESAMWTLIVSLVILSFGLVLKVAELRHRLKVSENEPNRLRSEIETLKKRYNKEISEIEELNKREMEKIKEESSNSTHKFIDLTDINNNFGLADYDPLNRNKK
jgi:archaellum component FlaC